MRRFKGIGLCPRHPNENPKENLKPKDIRSIAHLIVILFDGEQEPLNKAVKLTENWIGVLTECWYIHVQ